MTYARKTNALFYLLWCGVAAGCSDTTASALASDGEGTVIPKSTPSRATAGAGSSLSRVAEPSVRSSETVAADGGAGAGAPALANASGAGASGANVGGAGSGGRAGRGGAGGTTPTELPPPEEDEEEDEDEDEED